MISSRFSSVQAPDSASRNFLMGLAYSILDFSHSRP